MVLPAGLGAFFSVFYNVNQTKLLAETTTNWDESTEKEREVNESVPEDRKITKLKALHRITRSTMVDAESLFISWQLSIFMTNVRAQN